MSEHVNESGRQATARAEAMKVLTEKHGVPWADTSGYLAKWAESHSYTDALAQIKAGVVLPGAEPAKTPKAIVESKPAKKPASVPVPKPVVSVRDGQARKVVRSSNGTGKKAQ